MKPGTPIHWFRWIEGGNGMLEKVEATFVCPLGRRVRIQLLTGETKSVSPDNIQVRKGEEPRKPGEFREGDLIMWFRVFPGGKTEKTPAIFVGQSRRGARAMVRIEATGRKTLVDTDNIEIRRVQA